MSSYYAQNPHYAPDSDFGEDAERLERCDEEAGRYYRDAIRDAQVIYTRKVADLQPYWQTPRYDRERAAAKREFERVSKPAHELRIRTCRELFMTGEVSEELSFAWDALKQTPEQIDAAMVASAPSLDDVVDYANAINVPWIWKQAAE